MTSRTHEIAKLGLHVVHHAQKMLNVLDVDLPTDSFGLDNRTMSRDGSVARFDQNIDLSEHPA